MFSDVAARAKPYSIALPCIFEKPDQSDRLCWSPDKSIVQRQAHDLRALGALFVEQVGRPGNSIRRLLVEHGGFLNDRDYLGDELPFWVTLGGRSHLVIPS
jgi:hypothetical protein